MYHNVSDELKSKALENFDYKIINILLDEILAIAFRYSNLSEMSDSDKAKGIYNYLTREMHVNQHYKYNYILPNEETWIMRSEELMEDLQNILLEHSGTCLSISELYKLLLNKVGVESQTVICIENHSFQALNIIKRSGTWSFADVVRGILKDKEGTINSDFDYHRLVKDKQQILGIFPEAIFNKLIKKPSSNKYSKFKRNDIGLYDLYEEMIYNKEEKTK